MGPYKKKKIIHSQDRAFVYWDSWGPCLYSIQIYATFIYKKKYIIWILFQSINNIGFIPILFIINFSLHKWKSPSNICANANPSFRFIGDNLKLTDYAILPRH